MNQVTHMHDTTGNFSAKADFDSISSTDSFIDVVPSFLTLAILSEED